MGSSCFRQQNKKEIISQVNTNSKTNLHSLKKADYSKEALYEDPSRQEVNQNSQILQPDFLCGSRNRIAFICLDELCDRDCFHCEKRSCESCYKKHKVMAQSIPLKWFTDELNKKASGEAKFLKKIDEIQLNILNKLKFKKKSMIQKINLMGMDEGDQKIIKNIYINKSKNDISGKGLFSCFQKIQKFNQQLNTDSQSFENQFKKSMEALIKSVQNQKFSIIQRFSRNLMGNYSLSVQEKNINNFPNPSHPNSDYFTTDSKEEIIKIRHRNRNQQFHCFVFDQPVQQNRVNTFRVRQSHTYNQSIYIGIATNNIFGKVGAVQTLRNKELIAYSTCDGKVYESEKQNTQFMGRKIKDGQVISLQVNSTDWTLTWLIGSQKLATAKICQFMQQKALYLVVVMLWDDEVQLILR